ncbi:hypothetical protein WJX81_005913 [Elliptochloris bilobata]|uniref:Bidirectional sugar transporter SWEET n=1 Tax=Elliptochloris bilobata TaxID=381761 RepID=A0AAW1RBT1_9CHLO
MRAILRTRRTLNLGELNSLVFPVIVANCGGWVAYGIVRLDPFVFAPNALGVLLGLFYSLSALCFADKQAQDRIVQAFFFFTTLLLLAAGVTTFGHFSLANNVFIWGIVSNFISLTYYTAPLSTIAKVFHTRSAASLHAPICAMNMVNGVLWTAYGFATAQPFLFVPNAIGAALALFQVALCCIFRSKVHGPPGGGDAEAPTAHNPASRPYPAPGAATDDYMASTNSVDGLLPPRTVLSAPVNFAELSHMPIAEAAPAKRRSRGAHARASFDEGATVPM